jgi:hypothetical protein
MKSLLICPGERPAVEALATWRPLCIVPFLGKTLIEYWLEYLSTAGATQVFVLATDRPEQVRALVKDGARWGLKVEVLPEVRELEVEEARAKYQWPEDQWLTAPHDVILLDHLPGLPGRNLFASYATWFAALQSWMPYAATPERIGIRQIQPGVWVGLHSHIDKTASLTAPVWIGEDVHVGPGAIVGPGAVLEDRSYVESEAEIVASVVGPETFVGTMTEVRRTLAWGSTLVNWKRGVCVEVSDAFLVAPLGRTRSHYYAASWPARLAAFLVVVLTIPVALFPVLKAVLCGRRVLHPKLAIRPRRGGVVSSVGPKVVYHEFEGVPGWLRRWPQLWSIVRGEFAWVGNRPLSPGQAARLSNDFERLWLAAPVGLISMSDAECGKCSFDDESRAHATFYAARASWRLDWAIFAQAVFFFLTGIPYPKAREHVMRRLLPTAARPREVHR